MNPIPPPEGVFPLSLGTPPRTPIRAPRLVPVIRFTSGCVLGNRAFLRAWAGRRVARAMAAAEGHAGREQRPLAS
ncbi:MAG: hypothetical protein WD941_09160 [Opitutus sp.]